MDSSQRRPTGLRRLLRPRILIPALIAAVAGAAFVLYWFQPQALFLDNRVDENRPEAMIENATSQDDQMMSLSGSFRALKYETRGTALLAKQEDGSYLLRLEDFETQNGPDLKVYLSAAPADANPSTFDDDFINLGNLKGNIGNQNYTVPAGLDLEKYQSVVIWCQRFSVGFGVAPIG